MAGGLQIGSSGVVIGADGITVTDSDSSPCCCEQCLVCGVGPTIPSVNIAFDPAYALTCAGTLAGNGYTLLEISLCFIYRGRFPTTGGCAFDEIEITATLTSGPGTYGWQVSAIGYNAGVATGTVFSNVFTVQISQASFCAGNPSTTAGTVFSVSANVV